MPIVSKIYVIFKPHFSFEWDIFFKVFSGLFDKLFQKLKEIIEKS